MIIFKNHRNLDHCAITHVLHIQVPIVFILSLKRTYKQVYCICNHSNGNLATECNMLLLFKVSTKSVIFSPPLLNVNIIKLHKGLNPYIHYIDIV